MVNFPSTIRPAQLPSMACQPSWGMRGFTLMELMVVVGILGILVGFGVPSFQRAIAQNSINSGIGTLAGDMNFARSEALKRGLSVTMCASIDPYTVCTPGSPGLQWQGGWIVFLDRNANNARSTVAANNETLLRVQQNLPGDLIISGTNGSNVRSITFDRSGVATAAGLTVSTTTLDVQGQIDTSRAACISISGRTRTRAPGEVLCN